MNRFHLEKQLVLESNFYHVQAIPSKHSCVLLGIFMKQTLVSALE